MPRLPPAEKLPLAVRKNIRDEWDNKKADLEKQLSDVLGTAWTIDINPNAIYPYAEPNSYGNQSPGGCIKAYVEGAIYQLKYFVSRHGDMAVAELNSKCSAHTLCMDVDEANKYTYCGSGITDGKLYMLFNEKYLGTNIDHALEVDQLFKVIDDAPDAGGSSSNVLSLAARSSIEKDYEARIGEVKAKINRLLGKEYKLSPNFEETFAKLQTESQRSGNSVHSDWQRVLGNFAYSYFDGVAYTLDYQKFGDDEMLQEGLNEAADKAEIAFRIVDKLSYASYCEVVVEDGVLFIQTTADKWGTNIGEAAAKLLDQL